MTSNERTKANSAVRQPEGEQHETETRPGTADLETALKIRSSLVNALSVNPLAPKAREKMCPQTVEGEEGQRGIRGGGGVLLWPFWAGRHGAEACEACCPGFCVTLGGFTKHAV